MDYKEHDKVYESIRKHDQHIYENHEYQIQWKNHEKVLQRSKTNTSLFQFANVIYFESH